MSLRLPPPFSIDYEEDAERARIVVAGELDRLVADRFSRALRDAELGAAKRVEIEMSGLTFMDSAGLALLLQAARRAGGVGRELVVVDPAPPVHRLLEIAAMGHLVRSGGTREDG